MAIKWVDLGFVMVDVGFCTKEKDFNDWVSKEITLDNPKLWLSKGANATVSHFVENGSRNIYIISMDVRGRSKRDIASLLAHETIHVLQNIREDLCIHGNAKMGEYDAYLVQHIMYQCLGTLPQWKK